MTIFDLLFLALALVSAIALITAAAAALRGRRSRAIRILRNWAICTACYATIVVAVALASPQRILHIGDAWCFDDWCLSVGKVTQTPVARQIRYDVSLRIFSRARRVSQRAKGAWIYLVDQRGNRYAPEPDPSAAPLDVLLGPGESITTSRVFKLPADAGPVGLITGHGGAGWITKLIVADDGSLFHKPTLIRIN